MVILFSLLRVGPYKLRWWESNIYPFPIVLQYLMYTKPYEDLGGPRLEGALYTRYLVKVVLASKRQFKM
jgi:hypothetical protein